MSPNAKVCRSCGADRRETADQLNSAGIDDDDFDYEAFIAEEFGGGKKPRRPIDKVWLIAAVVLLVAFAAYAFSFW